MIQYADNIDSSLARLKTILGAGLQSIKKDIQSAKVKDKQSFNEISNFIVDQIYKYIADIESATIDQISGRLESKLNNFSLTLSNSAIEQIKQLLTNIQVKSEKTTNVDNIIEKENKVVNTKVTEQPEDKQQNQQQYQDKTTEIIQMLTSLSLDTMIDDFCEFIKTEYIDWQAEQQSNKAKNKNKKNKKNKKKSKIYDFIQNLFSSKKPPDWLYGKNIDAIVSSLSKNFTALEKIFVVNLKKIAQPIIKIDKQISKLNIKLGFTYIKLISANVFLSATILFLAVTNIILAISNIVLAAAIIFLAISIFILAIAVLILAAANIVLAIVYLFFAFIILAMVVLSAIVFIALVILVLATLVICIALLLAAGLITAITAILVIALFAIYIVTLAVMLIVTIIAIVALAVVSIILIAVATALTLSTLAIIVALALSIFVIAVLIPALLVFSGIILAALGIFAIAITLYILLVLLAFSIMVATIITAVAVALSSNNSIILALALALVFIGSYFTLTISMFLLFAAAILGLMTLSVALAVIAMSFAIIAFINLLIGNKIFANLLKNIAILGLNVKEMLLEKMKETLSNILSLFVAIIIVIIAIANYVWSIIKDYIDKFLNVVKDFYKKHIEPWLNKQSQSADESGSDNTSLWDKIKGLCKKVKSFFDEWFNKKPSEIKDYINNIVSNKLAEAFNYAYNKITEFINIKKILLIIKSKTNEIFIKALEWINDLFSGWGKWFIEPLLRYVDFKAIKGEWDRDGFWAALWQALKEVACAFGNDWGAAAVVSIKNFAYNTLRRILEGINWILSLFSDDFEANFDFEKSPYKTEAEIRMAERERDLAKKKSENEQFQAELAEIEEIEKHRSKEDYEKEIEETKQEIDNNEEKDSKDKAMKIVAYIKMLKLKLTINPTIAVVQTPEPGEDNLALV